MVIIAHASLDERGKISGGQPGDQNAKELCTREWYNKPWKAVLRPINSEIAEKSAQAAEAGVKNELIGYSQDNRNTLHRQALIMNYDLSKITTPCETDCSAFMTVCAIAGGVKELEYTGNAPTTRTMIDSFVKTGKYTMLLDSKYISSPDYLQRGDILVAPGKHTVMVLTNGVNASPSAVKTTRKISTSLSYPCKGVDVAAWQTNLNYEALKDNGVQFAILKIIRKDGQPDKMFETHYKGFKNAGVPITCVYNYSYATTVEAAKVAAQKVVKILDGRKIPVCLDVEDSCQKNLGEKLIDIINGYQKVIETAGLPFVLYTGMSFWNSFIKPYQAKLNSKNNWIARYYNGYNPMTIDQFPDSKYKPTMPNLMGWQYTSSLEIPGSPGRLDCSILYRLISGTTTPLTTTKKTTSTKVRVGVVTAKSLYVRQSPSIKATAIGFLKKGEKVQILDVDPASGWYKVYEGAWVSNKYIQII